MRKFYILLIITLFITPVLSLQAQTVDILWQGETYTPPFYQGKALWSKQSKITLVAMPQGLGSASTLNYKWTKNGTVLGNLSGVGKNTLSYVDTILSKSQRIKVDIMSSDGETVRATASTVITPSSPVVVVYENNPLYGFMFHKETSGTYSLKDREVTFAAFPFFFSTLNRSDNSISYEWRNNTGNTENLSSVTYRTPDDTSGIAEVGVHVSNPNKIIQDAKKSFLIEFNNSTPNI